MNPIAIVPVLLILANVLISMKGFRNQAFFDGYKFEVDKVLISKDYIRLVSSGFLHLGWMHLVFNMVCLYMFAGSVIGITGLTGFLLIYFVSLVGGNLFALLVHRNHGDYSSAGASGAVCGLIFSAIALVPGMHIGFFGLPLPIPAWLYGLVYVIFSIYGIRTNNKSVGHAAHLGGALAGMLLAVLMHPEALAANYVTILLITVPVSIFIYFLVTRPHMLIIDRSFKKKADHYDIDHRYNQERHGRQMDLDSILDKINRKGINSLSKEEKEKLKEYSER